MADVEKLLHVLHRLCDAGHTIVVIEHHPDIMAQADWIVDLGPEGGDAGGHIVVQGDMQKIMATQQSYTGQALKSYLSRYVAGFIQHARLGRTCITGNDLSH